MREILFKAVVGVVTAGVATSVWAGCRDLPQVPDSDWVKVKLNSKYRMADIDGDGVPEKIERVLSYGSGFTYVYLVTKLSLSGEQINIEVGGSHSSFINVDAIPKILLASKYAKVRIEIERMLFERMCDSFDPSAARLVMRIKQPEWHNGKPSIPANYTVSVSRRDFPELFKRHKVKTDFAWVTYFSHNHARRRHARLGPIQFKKLDENKRYQVLATAHGVVKVDKLKKRYAWVYVFPGGHKLRWPSVLGARLDKNNKIQIRLFKRFP